MTELMTGAGVKPGGGFQEANRFGPSRSSVICVHGAVATSQPLATLTGVHILEQGGSAADAAVAAAAILNVIEPMSTGVGGDVFALYFDSSKGQTFAVNGSGRSPAAATLGEVRNRLAKAGKTDLPFDSPLTWTVPGAVDAWEVVLKKWGRMSLADVLAPAIRAAEEGFAVAPQTAATWMASEGFLSRHGDSARTWLSADGHAPRPGQRFQVASLGRTLRSIAEGGREAFYRSPIADAIVAFSERNGGLFTKDDFAGHASDFPQPLRGSYRGYEVLAFPPNSQGVAVLEALAILGSDDLASMGPNNIETIHLQVEAMKLALHDAQCYVTDPQVCQVKSEFLLTNDWVKAQRGLISAQRAIADPVAASTSGDTVYICAVDQDGNAASFINSVYMPWASGYTVGDTGILLQNRGHCFSLDPNCLNVLGPAKRCRHTLAPGMVLEDGRPLLVFGFVGGDMQVQAQVQFLCNVIDFGMNIQDALDAPRWRYNGTGASLAIESAIGADTAAKLIARGHQITGAEGFFGGGQAVLIDRNLGSLQAGSDGRRDGCAIGY
jgi:gamma-glutamyltranspeptidase/glutathione hydrolase